MKAGTFLWIHLLILLAAGNAVAAQPDAANCMDHPLFPTRMPDYRKPPGGACQAVAQVLATHRGGTPVPAPGNQKAGGGPPMPERRV